MRNFPRCGGAAGFGNSFLSSVRRGVGDCSLRRVRNAGQLGEAAERDATTRAEGVRFGFRAPLALVVSRVMEEAVR